MARRSIAARRRGRALRDRRASHALTRTVPIEGANAAKPQMRRVRVSPDNDMWWCRRTRTPMRRSFSPTASSRSRRSRPRSRPWALASRRRQACLSVLPRRRGGVRVRARNRARDANFRHRRRLRVHRRLSLKRIASTRMANRKKAMGQGLLLFLFPIRYWPPLVLFRKAAQNREPLRP